MRLIFVDLAFSTLQFYTSFMQLITGEPKWEKTNVTNLLRNRQSGKLLARVRVNGKQKWRVWRRASFPSRS